ncbi:MAG: RNA-binding protein [Acidobacteria bacterium RIFCSPLOWO2_12_FULL_59_11]|nr:MAG: RNA-binding protein [Acidobacteria bacterium RIFCSPLOWO2_12_FULL_59_11]
MKNLFVGNMSFHTTEDELRALFEPFGEITRIQVMTDRDTGRSRGFAFVEMASDDEASKAITELNSKEVDGRALNVNEARPKPERSGPRGNGGGGGRGGYSRDSYGGASKQRREPRW